jgi:uncharacterized protein (TIGR02452 family)
MAKLVILPCLDSQARGAHCYQVLRRDMTSARAVQLGRSAVEAAESGIYLATDGREVNWKAAVDQACARKLTIPPSAALPAPTRPRYPATQIQVANETTLAAASGLVSAGHRVLALSFANGTQPGGGFLSGALSQEEVLCRSSALYLTLRGDPMYEAHGQRWLDSSDWAILSPDVPVFRTDDGTPLDTPFLVSFLSCAAPYVPAIRQPKAGDLLQARIKRVFEIAQAFEYSTLGLGAWGCGAFHNDVDRTARDFRSALEDQFAGAFQTIIFAIADWSPERRFLTPFTRVFPASSE